MAAVLHAAQRGKELAGVRWLGDAACALCQMQTRGREIEIDGTSMLQRLQIQRWKWSDAKAPRLSHLFASLRLTMAVAGEAQDDQLSAIMKSQQ